MYKLYLTFIAIALLPSFIFCQNKETQSMLASIEGQWSLDNNNNVTYQQVIEIPDLTIDEIYQRAESYFIYNYSSGKSVIQTKDKESGIIIAKGLYTDIHTAKEALIVVNFDTWHIIKIEIKEGRARVTLSLTGYNEKIVDMNGKASYYDELEISQYFPINPESKYKNAYGKALYYSHMRAISSMKAIEKALKEGNTDKESDTW